MSIVKALLETLINQHNTLGSWQMLYSYCTTTNKSQSGPKKDQKLVFKTKYCLMQVKSIAECSLGASLTSLLRLFLSGRLTQDLLYGKCFLTDEILWYEHCEIMPRNSDQLTQHFRELANALQLPYHYKQ